MTQKFTMTKFTVRKYMYRGNVTNVNGIFYVNVPLNKLFGVDDANYIFDSTDSLLVHGNREQVVFEYFDTFPLSPPVARFVSKSYPQVEVHIQQGTK